MNIARMISKVITAPIRIVDIPFRIAREIVDDPEPERGALADIAEAAEKAIVQTLKGD